MQRETESGVRVRSLLAVGLVLLVLAVWLLSWQWESVRGAVCGSGPTVSTGDSAETLAAREQENAARPALSEPLEPFAELRRVWQEQLGSEPLWPADLEEPRDCAQLQSELDAVCALLDSRDYVREARLSGGSCDLLRQAAQSLSSRPPALSAELRSYEAMLGNVFHLYRVLGKRRMLLLRRMVHDEPMLAEPLALAEYRWLISRDRCATDRSGRIAPERLYDYASFLFQTLGGQAYLRRRTPQIEAITAFYALRILDRSVERGHNPNGIDPRAEIERTRQLVESQPLLFREQYLEILEGMERRWESRGE